MFRQFTSPCTPVLVSLPYIALSIMTLFGSAYVFVHSGPSLMNSGGFSRSGGEIIATTIPTRPSSRVSFGLSKIMTPRTTILLCVFTSLTRRYSGLSGPLRRHTPTKSRNGCTNWRKFTSRLSLDSMITSPHTQGVFVQPRQGPLGNVSRPDLRGHQHLSSSTQHRFPSNMPLKCST